MYQRWSWINAWVSLNYHDILLQEVHESANIGKPSIFPLSLPSLMWNNGTYPCSHCPGQICRARHSAHCKKCVKSTQASMLALNSHVSIAYILCDVYCVAIVFFFFLDPKIGTYESESLTVFQVILCSHLLWSEWQASEIMDCHTISIIICDKS